MAANPLGSGVTRFVDARDRQFAATVFQADTPPLDSELNLVSLMELEARAEAVRAESPSGWLMHESSPRSDYHTNPSWSNHFFFGKKASGEARNFMWAVVNGWLVPVTGTQTGAPPLAANNADTWNKILLHPPGSSTGGNRSEFVFLEVWLARIDVDPPSGIAAGKPQRGFVHRLGNVEGGFSYLPDELVDPDLNAETSKRVQIQYRIRVIQDVNVSQNPEGFDPTLVFAQGMLSVPSVAPFANMRQELGDPGLWRAGTGDPATFGTVDGYVYAIPLCSVFRRNSAGFSDVGNLAGAFNRNSVATTRADATSYTAPILLPGAITDTTTTFVLTSIAGTVLSTMNSFGEAYFKIDDEIVRVTSVVAGGPSSFTVTFDRGQLQTVNRSHFSGTELKLYTVRPDGMFSDQVSATDVLDMRHSVAQKFDYENVLKTNVVELLKGQLRTAWKRYGSTNSAGPVVFYGDRVTDSTISVGGLTRLDAPDGNRRVFSDAAVVQRFSVPVQVPTNSSNVGDSRDVDVAPYNIVARWSAAAPSHGAGNRLHTILGGQFASWWNGDQIKIEIASFRAGLPAGDAAQVRFVLPTEDPDAVIARFEGMTSDPNGGVIPSPPATSSATTTNLPVPSPTAKRIFKHGQGMTVTLDGSGNLLLTLQGAAAAGTVLEEFVEAMQTSNTDTFAQKLLLHVQVAVLYGPGRGLSHKPEYVHTVHYRGSPTNSSKVMLRGGLGDRHRMIPTYLGDSPYVQTGNNRTYARTSEVMVDPGSKTLYVAPYRNTALPVLLARNGEYLNWYTYVSGLATYTQFQGCMPWNTPDNATTIHGAVDPLDLFYSSAAPGDQGDSRYVELPMEYLPRPGLHHIPLQAVTNTVFPSGLNFLLMSKQGPMPVDNTKDHNRNLVSYPNAAGYCVVTPKVGESFGFSSGTRSIFGQKYQNPALRSAFGGVWKGIKFPPFLAPARITGVYVRQSTAVIPASSPFDTDRNFVGGVGTDVNLLRDNFDGATVLLEADQHGDLYFVLAADALDLSKVPGTTFDAADFIVECTLFGYDRGFLQTNGRLCVAKNTGGGSRDVPEDQFLDSIDGVGIIAPAPLAVDASNNELTAYYSRAPYQGDVFGTQSAYSDDSYRLGPMSATEAQAVRANPLGPVSTLSLPNRAGYEVLSAVSFMTTLGTGRLSGPTPIPLLTKTEAPGNPLDVTGSIVDVERKFSLNRVGYEDWASVKFPVAEASLAVRPTVLPGALSEVYDNDVHQEFAGCVSQLPLGAYFRDKDFVGKTAYQTRSASNVGAIPLGSLAFVGYQASMIQGAAGQSTWEGTEFVCGNNSGTAGVGSEALIRVDGTPSTTSTTVFKTTRGGAAYSATSPWPGGVLSSRFPRARPNAERGSVLLATAYLVRSQPESVGGLELHPGSELQMIVVTHALPSYFRDTDIVHSASGMNEGYTAVDRFRLGGRPMEKRRGDVDTTIVPSDKPLFVNRVFDNPILFGSSDVAMTTPFTGKLVVSADGQTAFVLPKRPLSRDGVLLFLNGAKLTYGDNFLITGASDTDVTYLVTVDSPALVTGDVLEYWFILL